MSALDALRRAHEAWARQYPGDLQLSLFDRIQSAGMAAVCVAATDTGEDALLLAIDLMGLLEEHEEAA